jgi:hypothetical protein
MALVKALGKDYLSKPIIDDKPFFKESSEGSDFVICKSPDKLKALLDTLQQDKQVHFISDGDWSLHDMTMELLKKYKPAELYITTYAIREFPVRQLVLAQERREIICLKMLLDVRAKMRTPEVYQLANMNANKISLTSIHAKVTVIKSTAGCVTIVGSQNWTQNPRIEAGVVSLEPAVAEFHINWIEKAMENAEIFE